ncbi:hypothetical protein B0A55_02421 [Friedmanniomyces simplex]|uniref:Uncharacterized protein n=1 Tax=Friedmanniomyces simplex TaxID=329884 RepID=A0A4U0XRF2_9PEZI|nr:hypothetical protein B0A55_02421 [Friedmanniomyces simplex]
MSSDHSSNVEDPDTATADRHSKRERKRQEKVQHQAEIEARTNAGESCKQIAAALQANGHKISDKTIARWRVQWGHRQRATRNTKGQPLRAPRVNLRRDVARDGTRRSDQDATKDRITQLTRDGKSAEEIFEILQAQGVVMKKGVSTVWRLQTYWKLIPFDSDRANGTGPYSKWKTQPCRQKTDKRRVPKADRPPTAKKAKEGDSTVQVADGIVLHYPTNCAFGPQKRRPGASQTELDPGLRLGAAADPMHIDSDSEPDPGFYNELGGDDLEMGCDHEVPRDRGREVQSPKHWQQQTSTYPNTHAAAQPTQPSATFTGGTDVMSAELLVDLANSALVAATDLKDLVLAVQMRRPARNSMSASPPSAEDIMKARRRVREAASVVVELAMG